MSELRQTVPLAPVGRERLPSLREVLRWRPPRLRFEGEMEERFGLAAGPGRLRHSVTTGLVALLVYNLFILADWYLVPDVFYKALWIRLGCYTPLALFLLVLGSRFRGLVLMLPDAFLEGAVTLVAAAAAISLGAVILLTDSPLAMVYRAGLVPVLVYGNLVQRLRFRFAVVFALAVVATYVVSVFGITGKAAIFGSMEVPIGIMVVSVAAYTLVSNFRMEYEERQRFLMGERAQELREALRLSHEQLDALSRRDALTGVGNRRHFDEVMQQRWDEMRNTGGELALLLIDVDHFKAFNDHYGHPAGDECLRHVAREVRRRIPPAVGTVARWGGEEFVVVLHYTNIETAMHIAQSVREAVQSLALRHEGSKTAAMVTISIGVATARPRQSNNPPDDLVAAADVALYRAKSEGRNRCVADTAA